MRWVSLAMILCCLSSTTWATEKRCGWYENPTPGNHWFIDRDATWILGVQGKDLATGFWDAKRKGPDIWNTASWIKPYPTVCGCFEGVFGEVDANRYGKVDRIETIEHLSLDRCENDPSLPQMR